MLEKAPVRCSKPSVSMWLTARGVVCAVYEVREIQEVPRATSRSASMGWRHVQCRNSLSRLMNAMV